MSEQIFDIGDIELVQSVKDMLDTKGWWLLKGYPVDTKSVKDLEKELTQICSAIGKPVAHDAEGAIVWNIKAAATAKGSVITYSQHSHEADLHTDSQYSDYPEDYFSLLTLEKAKCGGGQSYILTLEDIIDELHQTADGREAYTVLSTTYFPFIVPNVFKKNKESDVPEIVFGKIITNDNEIRFRVDTIQKALEHDPSFCTKEQIKAFSILVKLVRETRRTIKFHLEKGDLVIINNKKTLHGRSSFTDADRHLLRVRMNKI